MHWRAVVHYSFLHIDYGVNHLLTAFLCIAIVCIPAEVQFHPCPQEMKPSSGGLKMTDRHKRLELLLERQKNQHRMVLGKTAP